MMSSEQLERQTEQNRAEVELTIDELRARLSPGQIVDEVLSYWKDGGSQFATNLGRQVTNNPLPVALIGGGLAWFLFGQDANTGRGGSYRGDYRDRDFGRAGDRTSERLGDMASKAGGTVQDAMGGVRHAAETAGASVSDTAKSLGETASSAYHATSSKVSDVAAQVTDHAAALEHKTLTAAHDLIDQMKAQPLMLVGIGLALGAVLGAAFPSTEIENRVMGDAADDVKRDAKHVASEQMEKAKDTAKDTAQEFVDEAVNVPGNGAQRRGMPVEHFG